MKWLNYRLAATLLLTLAGCQTQPTATFTDGTIARWSLTLPYESHYAGWLNIQQDATRKYSAKLLWRGGSPNDVTQVTCDGEVFTLRIRDEWPNQENPEAQRYRIITGKLRQKNQSFQAEIIDGTGKKVETLGEIKAVALPPPGPKPNLSKAVKGEPIDLLTDGLKGWKPVGKNKGTEWSFSNGILTTTEPLDEDGKPILTGRASLQTVRQDFYDFNITTDVRVSTNSNSGVYLRGLYEIQVLNSYGKCLDSHHMGALYGRITPLVAAERPAGVWQKLDITLYKRHVTVKLNHRTVIDHQPVEGVTGNALHANEFIPGPIYLQSGHGVTDYRNMILTPLK